LLSPLHVPPLLPLHRSTSLQLPLHLSSPLQLSLLFFLSFPLGICCSIAAPIANSLYAPHYNPHMPDSPQQDPRVYFAAERTFLAWIRTGLGLMGVGFAVSRFGLFLREFSDSQHVPTQVSTTHSVITGVALVSLGVLINIVSVINHLVVVKKLSTGTWQPGQPSRTAVALAILLAVLGIGMAIYLIHFR